MKKRVTITLDEKQIRMLRNKQTQMMLDGNKPVSFSAVLSEILFKSINIEKMIDKDRPYSYVKTICNW